MSPCSTCRLESRRPPSHQAALAASSIISLCRSFPNPLVTNHLPPSRIQQMPLVALRRNPRLLCRVLARCSGVMLVLLLRVGVDGCESARADDEGDVAEGGDDGLADHGSTFPSSAAARTMARRVAIYASGSSSALTSVLIPRGERTAMPDRQTSSPRLRFPARPSASPSSVSGFHG